MRKNLKSKVLISVLAIGLSYGMQSAEAGLQPGVLPENHNIYIATNIGSGFTFNSVEHEKIVTPFYYDANYTKGKSYEKNAINNQITMTGSRVDNIYGAYTTSGTTEQNKVTITGGKVGYFAVGAYSKSGLQRGNVLNATNCDAVSLYGAMGGGKLINNVVEVSCNNTSIDYDRVAGAYATGKNIANENYANFKSGEVFYFAGAITEKSAANYNVAIIQGGNVHHGYGAFGLWATANLSYNWLDIYDGSKVTTATGAESLGGSVKYNTVEIYGGEVNNIYGGVTHNNGSATGNKVSITSGSNVKVAGNIVGAMVEKGSAKDNKVDVAVNCGSIQEVFGAQATGGSVTNNEAHVILNNVKNVYGACTNGKGTATGNTAFVGNGTANSIVGAITELGSAKYNKAYYVNCDGPADSVFGAMTTGGGLATGNLAYIDDADCKTAYGAMTTNNGKATSNTLEIAYSKVNTAMGAYAENGAVSKNSVLLRDYTHIVDLVYGATSTNGNATSNKVTLNNKSYVGIDGSGLGGMSTYGTVSKNSIEVDTSSDYSGCYYGGFSFAGKVTSNKASYSGNQALAVIGGASQTGLVSQNSATLIAGKVTDLVGGVSFSRNATKNKVNVSAGQARYVVGGYSGDESVTALASYNTVNINGGDFAAMTGESSFVLLSGRPGIYGGVANMNTGTAATKNVVNFNGGIAGEVYGAMAKEGNVTYNTVNMKTEGAQACYRSKDDYVYGGYTEKGNVVSNTVNMSAGTARNIAGGWSVNGNATSNKVNISGTAKIVTRYNSSQESASCDICGGYASDTASKNTVSVKNAETDNANVYGGKGLLQSISNNVTVSDADVKSVYGGVALAYANKNSVTIKGYSTVHGDVYGGNAIGETNSNTVSISGNTNINGNVYGGNVTGNYNKITLSGNAHVQKNVVVCKEGGIGNSITMSGKASVGGTISGYQKQKGVPKDQQIISGGSLILDDWSGSVGAVEGFDTISFERVSGKAGTSMMVLAKGEESDLSGTTVTVNNAILSSPVQSLSLISSEDGKLDLSETKLEDGSGATVGTVGRMKLIKQDGAILASYAAADANPQTKALAESRTAAAAFVNQGTEIVEHGINQVAAGEVGSKTFAAVFGNASRYNTGSHVKVNGWSEIVGIGNTTDNGKLTYGAFFENGTGNYRTFASAMGMPIRGYGEATYNGGGVLAKKKLVQGTYVEGAVRAGRLQNKLNDAVLGGSGLKGYDVSTGYYGAHIGLGKEIKLNENSSVDVYLKYLFTHHSSKNYRIDGDEFRFDSMNSQRTRLGFRINSQVNNKAKLYYGLVWDYEMDGKADNKVQGYSLHTPSLKGSTVFLDLGAEYKLNEKWSLDLNAKGYAGERRGVTGSAQVTYNF